MDLETLEKLIITADSIALTYALEPLSEAERKKLSKEAQKLFKETEKKLFDYQEINVKSALGGLIEIFKNKAIKIASKREIYDTAKLAVIGLCPISVTKKINYICTTDEEEQYLIKILSDRNPDWLDQWIESKIEGEWASIKWSTLRALYEKGLCSKPTSDRYIELMVSDINWYTDKKTYKPLSQKLKENPDLLEYEIWQIFKTENSAFQIYNETYNEHAPENFENWSTAITKLTEEGLLDRDRIINSALDALNSGFKNNHISGFIKFLDKINLSAEELNSKQKVFLDLLTSQTTSIITYALKHIKIIDKNKALDDESFIKAALPVFNISTKTQPATVLQLIDKIAKRNPSLNDSIKSICLEALKHESADIQEKSLNILEKILTEKDQSIIAEIVNTKDTISSSLQSRIEILANNKSYNTVLKEQIDSKESLEDIDQVRNELLNKCKSFNDSTYKKYNIDQTIKNIEQFKLPDNLELNILDMKMLPSLDLIKPIEDAEELLEVISHAVEEVEKADEVERILDAISRLSNPKSDNFKRLSPPLIKRIKDLQKSENSKGLTSSWNAPYILESLILCWLTNQKRTLDIPDWFKEEKIIAFIEERLKEIIKQVLSKTPAILLAAPTHTRGWIDPIILVERLKTKQTNNEPINKYDFIQALLRITPDNRQQALYDAKDVDGIEGTIIRYALGSSEPIEKKDGKYFDWWIAAGRARNPYGELKELEIFKQKNIGPDHLIPAEYDWEVIKESTHDSYSKKNYYHMKLQINTKPTVPAKKCPAEYPTVLIHDTTKDIYLYLMISQWGCEWVHMVSPLNSDPYFVTGIKRVISRIDMKASTWEPNHIYFEPIFETNRPLNEMAYLLLSTGLISADGDTKGYAVDAMAESIQDGRIHPEPLAKTLIKLSQSECVKLNRLASSFSEIARLSDTHSLVIAQTIDLWLLEQKELTRDAHHILSLLVELVNTLDLIISEESLTFLKTIKGSSKGAKLAKSLLNFTPKSDFKRQQALLNWYDNIITRLEN